MKKIIIIFLLVIIILIGINVILWQKGQMDQLKENVIETTTIEKDAKVVKRVDNTERSSKIESIDDVWNQYTNYEQGFKIKFPKEVRWGEIKGKSKIVEDGNVIYLGAGDNWHSRALDVKKSNKTIFEKANSIQPFTFLVQKVSNEQELENFVKNALDDTMKISKIVESDIRGTHNVYFENSATERAGLGGPPPFTGRIIKYSPEKGLAAMWSNYGHEPTFPWQDEDGGNMTARDEEVSDSFEFLDSYQKDAQNKDTTPETIIPSTAKTNQPSLFSAETNPTLDWQVYRSGELGFEMKYPNDWRYIDMDEEGVMFGPKEIREDAIMGIIVLDEMPSVGDTTHNSEVTRIENRSFAYQRSKEVYTKYSFSEFEVINIIVQRGDNFISIRKAALDTSDPSYVYAQTINRMLDTFRFIE